MERTLSSVLLMFLLTTVPFGMALADAPPEGGAAAGTGDGDPSDVLSSVPASGLLENMGQIARDDVLFYSTGNPMVGIGRDTVVTALFDDEGNGYAYEMTFIGAHPRGVEGRNIGPGYLNFLKGNDPAGWATGVRTFEEVHHSDLYPGIDLVFRTTPAGVKYDLLVHPGADSSMIELGYRFTSGISIDRNGDLLIGTPLGTVVEERPVAYQGDKRIDAAFRSMGEDRIAFSLGDHDDNELLVIDPLLKQSTYLGGRDDEMTESPPFLHQGDLIVAGTTYSTNFPTTSGAVDTACSQYDAFVTRMSSDLGTLVWSTFLGGTEMDYGYDLDVDTSGNVYVTGSTEALDFPVTKGAFDTTSNIRTVVDEWGWEYIIPDAYASKLASDGKSLIYSTFIGGKGNDTGSSIAIDPSGNAFVGGVTDSSDLPTEGPYQDTLYGNQDGFVLVLDTTGSSLVYSTYLGGNDNWGEMVMDIEIDSNGQAVVMGYTSASDFPVTSGAYNTVYVYDIYYVTKFTKDGSDLDWSTFLFMDTYANDICLHNDEVYVTGYTYNTAFPATKDAYSSTMNGWVDAFASILSSDGSKLVYSTLFGGTDYEIGYHITVDSQGAMVVSGTVASYDFPMTKDTYQATLNGYQDAFLIWFTVDRKALYFSTYFGGSQDESGYGTVLPGQYEPCLYGTTTSSDMPTTKGAYSTTFSGGWQDVFLAKFKTNSFKPGRPLSLDLTSGNSIIDLSWSAPMSDGNETITAYTIYRSLNNDSFDPLKTVNGDTFAVNDTTVQNGNVYYYYVSATNIVGEGPVSNTVSGMPITVPSVPLDFELRKGDGFIELAWDYPTDDGGDPYVEFNIYSGEDPGELGLSVERLDGLLYNFSGLTNGIIHYFQVTGVTKGGEGPGTTVLSAYPSTVPSSPMGLRSTRGDRFVHLRWEAPSDLGGESEVTYNVFLSTNNVTFNRIATKLSVTEYNVTALENGMVLYFRVTAVNVRGEGPVSNVVDDRPIGAPSEPREVQVTTGDGSAVVRWMPPNSMGGDVSVTYNVYVGTGVYQMELRASNLSVTELLVEGLVNGLLYYFSVSAENTLFEGPFSLFVTGTPLRAPSVPLDLSLEAGDGKITLSWSPPADLGGDISITYEVFFGTTIESLMLTATTEVPTYHEPGLKNGRTYHAMVRAKNLAGTGPFTEPVSGVPMGRPSAPMSLIVARGDRGLNVSWTRPLDLGGADHVTYTIYLSNASRSMFPYATSIEGTAHSLAGLENGVKYQVSVTAVNPAGESAPSSSVEATPMTVPGVPVFEVTAGDSVMNITWTLPLEDGGGEVTQLRIYRAVKGEDLSFHRMVPASKGSFTDVELENGVTYLYALSCVNEVGEGPRSGTQEATPEATEGPRSISGLLIVGISLMLLVLAIVLAVVLFIVRKRKKALAPQEGPTLQQLQAAGYYPTGAQLPPGYGQGLPPYQQYGLPPATPPMATPPQQFQQPQYPEPVVQQQPVYYPPVQGEAVPQPLSSIPEQTVEAGPLPENLQVTEGTSSDIPPPDGPPQTVQQPDPL